MRRNKNETFPKILSVCIVSRGIGSVASRHHLVATACSIAAYDDDRTGQDRQKKLTYPVFPPLQGYY